MFTRPMLLLEVSFSVSFNEVFCGFNLENSLWNNPFWTVLFHMCVGVCVLKGGAMRHFKITPVISEGGNVINREEKRDEIFHLSFSLSLCHTYVCVCVCVCFKTPVLKMLSLFAHTICLSVFLSASSLCSAFCPFPFRRRLVISPSLSLILSFPSQHLPLVQFVLFTLAFLLSPRLFFLCLSPFLSLYLPFSVTMCFIGVTNNGMFVLPKHWLE